MKAFTLLGTYPDYGAYWWARFLSILGDTITSTALLLAMAQVPDAARAVSLLLLAQTIPRFLGIWLGSVVDRVSQRKLMIFCDSGQALLFAAIALTDPPFPLFLLIIFVTTTFATLFAPAGRSAVPQLVSADNLASANALLGIGVNTALALGPAVGGLLFAQLGLSGVLLLNAGTFCLSILLLCRLPPLTPVPSQRRPTALWRAAWSGLIFVFRHQIARAIAIGLFLVVAFAALDNVALVFLAQDVLDTSPMGYGLLASMYGIGMIAGPLILLRWAQQDMVRWLLGSIACMALGAFGTGMAPMLGIAIVAQFIAGVGNGIENVANDTLLQQSVRRDKLGRTFSVVYSGAAIAAALAYSVGGFLVASISPRLVFLVAGSGLLLTMLVMWFIVPRDLLQVSEDDNV